MKKRCIIKKAVKYIGDRLKVLKKRKPAVAGQFYDAEPDRLRRTIKECFLDVRGPGSLPKIKKSGKKLFGVVVPHAGFIFSGAIAAHSFFELTESGFADTFIILGPNHTGMGSGVALMSEGEWKTPLGDVAVNQKLADMLKTGIIDNEESSHQQEHSIEVQLPFLQFCAGKKDFDFVPISMMMQDIDTIIEVGNIIKNAVDRIDCKIAIVASSDFSHVGFNYMSMPPSDMRVDKYAEKQDTLAINKILDMNPKGLVETVETNNISMCGYGPVGAMIQASKKLGAKRAELLKYGSSYEVHPGSSCVGYGAIAIY